MRMGNAIRHVKLYLILRVQFHMEIRLMRLAPATVAVTMVLALMISITTAVSSAQAQSAAPQSALAKAGHAMNPMNWSMPKVNFLSKPEPPRITKKESSVFSTVSKKTASGWNRTKNALNPSNLFPSKPKTAASEKKSPGFFSSMFQPKPQAPQQVTTVNDFLSLPRAGTK